MRLSSQISEASLAALAATAQRRRRQQPQQRQGCTPAPLSLPLLLNIHLRLCWRLVSSLIIGAISPGCLCLLLLAGGHPCCRRFPCCSWLWPRLHLGNAWVGLQLEACWRLPVPRQPGRQRPARQLLWASCRRLHSRCRCCWLRGARRRGLIVPHRRRSCCHRPHRLQLSIHYSCRNGRAHKHGSQVARFRCLRNLCRRRQQTLCLLLA
jgi:hypothetical protein